MIADGAAQNRVPQNLVIPGYRQDYYPTKRGSALVTALVRPRPVNEYPSTVSRTT